MEKLKIYLDDVRPAPDGWVLYTSAEELSITLDFRPWNEIEVISFDHDLGDNMPTGYDVLKMMEERVLTNQEQYVPKLEIHSVNPVGRKNMEAAIKSINQHLMEIK